MFFSSGDGSHCSKQNGTFSNLGVHSSPADWKKASLYARAHMALSRSRPTLLLQDLTSMTICRHRSTFFVPSFESSSTEQRVIIELPDTSVVARCCSAARNRRQGLLDCR
jgi:hypothetical protein